jgi:hypothetical protein
VIRTPASFPHAGAALRRAIERARLLSADIPWVVSPEDRARRAALVAGLHPPEPVSLTGGTWPFDDDLWGTLSESEYRRERAKKKAEAPTATPGEMIDILYHMRPRAVKHAEH